MPRLSLLLALICPLLSLAASTAAPPNIVMIVSDDQGYRDLGCFGADECQTPHLDRLATQGVRATGFYVTWPACTPSRGSILTGRYPQRNGLYDMIRNNVTDYGYKFDDVTYAVSPEMTIGMDLREVMISHVLKEAGYTCGVFGKWDGGRARRFLPRQRGFDDFYGFSNTGIDYWTHERYGVPSMFRGNELIKEQGYATDLFTREALRFVRQHKDRPFFLYLPYNAPHGASNLDRPGVQAPDDWIAKYADSKAKDARIRYMAAVTCMDDGIGQVLKLLDELKLADNTLVIFFSDNGGSGIADNAPLRGRKATMWEGGLRVPLIARWPGKLPAGKTTDEFLTSLELFPMLCAAAGTPLPKDVIYDGFDMTPVLAGKAKSQRTEMFWERRHDKAARVGNYKWVETPKYRGLFDLANDTGEERDLSTEQPEVLARVKARFAAWRKQMDDCEPRGPFRNY